ncbi:hypothetical protein KEM54_006721 [Ascosphaera aggregata]|nr:hypothetical protein KEM54_006721 [Ascosphaera aggregata]
MGIYPQEGDLYPRATATGNDVEAGTKEFTASESEVTSQTDAEVRLERGLKARHITMIAIGGAVGTGLLIGTGSGLARAGPGPIMISYSFVGFIVYLVMCALGEMSAWLPIPSGFTGYASRLVDPAFSFALGWTYFFKYMINTPNQLTASAMVISYWVPRDKLNPGVFIAILLVIIIFINYFGVSFFGELEFWLSSVKVVIVFALIILCLVLAAGGGPDHDPKGFRYWHDPGAFNWYIEDSPAGKFYAFWSTMVTATFAYLGTELVGVTVGEAQNPRKTIPNAIRLTFYRIMVFYVISVFLLGMLVPFDSPELAFALHASSSANASPFVVAIKLAGIKVLPGILNACLLIFVFSAANSDLYITARTLYGLAREKHAPYLFAKTNAKGVPVNALIASALTACLAFLNVSDDSKNVFSHFVNLVTIFGVISWICITYTHTRFVKARNLQGVPVETLAYKAPFGVAGSYFALVFCIIIALTKNYDVFVHKEGKSFDAKSFVTAYIGILAFFVFWISYKVIKKTKFVNLLEADIWTGKAEIDREEAAFLAQQEARKAANGGKVSFYKSHKRPVPLHSGVGKQRGAQNQESIRVFNFAEFIISWPTSLELFNGVGLPTPDASRPLPTSILDSKVVEEEPETPSKSDHRGITIDSPCSTFSLDAILGQVSDNDNDDVSVESFATAMSTSFTSRPDNGKSFYSSSETTQNTNTPASTLSKSYETTSAITTSSQTSTQTPSPIDLQSIGVLPFDLKEYPHLVGSSGDVWYTCNTTQQLDSGVKRIIDELVTHGPFSQKSVFPTNTPFRARYEIERIARYCNTDTKDIIDQLDNATTYCWDNYSELWKELEKHHAKLPEKTRSAIWDGAVGDFKDPNEDYVVTLTAELLPMKKQRGRFALNIHPMKYERGHRFGRRFGPDRFLELIIPQMKGKREIEHEAITRWLATCEHHIFGRIWRAFYFENRKATARDRLTAKVSLFAVDGDDFLKFSQPLNHLDVAAPGQSSAAHTPMTIDALITWLIPLHKNDRQKDLKLFQRIHLGLSRSTPTAILRQNEIFFVLDMKSPTGETMNDGCSLMSRSLAQHVSSILDLNHIPAAFQARISGAKGMWIVDKNDSRHPSTRNFWVEINESQLKIFPPPSEDDRELDSEQLTFGVVKWFDSLSPAELNVQVLRVLQHGGIQKSHVENLLKHEIALAYDEFKAIVKPKKAIQTRKWLQRWLRPSKSDRKAKRIDDFFPLNDAGKALALIDAGCLPLELPFLTEIFRNLLSNYFAQLESMHIQVSRSTYAFCIADPYGVLEPGEVHLGFSRAWEHDFHNGTELDDIDVLVARLPAHLPTDIQKRRAVYKRELAHLKDVIIFPTNGDIPLASELSGGDYDGDTVWVCWDDKIVDVFQNTPFSSKGPDRSREVFRLIDHSRLFDGNIDEFLAKSFSFNAIPPMLGYCTNVHEKLCYAQNSIATDETILLADLLGHLVDSGKSGLELTSESWSDFMSRALGKLGLPKLPELAHKKMDDAVVNESHIIDYLKFCVIDQEKERVLSDFSSFCNEGHYKDDAALMKPWQEAKEDLQKQYHYVADRIVSRVRSVHDAWMARSKKNDSTYEASVVIAVDAFNAITPPNSAHALCVVWNRCEHEWKLVKASCAYSLWPRSKFPFIVSGFELCEIKARSRGAGQIRHVVADVYEALRVSKSSVKRIGDAGEEELSRAQSQSMNSMQDGSCTSYI